MTMVLTGCPMGVAKAKEQPKAMVIRTILASSPADLAMAMPMGARMIGAAACPDIMFVNRKVTSKIAAIRRIGDALFEITISDRTN